MDQGSHCLKQTHGDLWDFVAPELEAKCAEVKHQLPRDGTCPWCERTLYSRHYHQCNVIFQSALLGLLHGRQRDGRLRELATGPSGSAKTTERSETAPREQLSGRTTKQEGQANKTGRQGSRPRPPPGADRERSDHAGIAMSAARGRIEPHQAGDIPHTAPSTTRARSRAQGAVQRRHRVASQEEQALRVVLFGLLLAETQARIQLFSKDDAAVKAAQTNHVLDKDKRFVYQKWDAQASKLVTDPDKKG